MNIESYLKRIGYHGPMTPTAETLRDLQVAHLLNVPFENLSIHSGEPIVLNDEALFTKIVEKRRGGFCYEVNGLFTALLRALGFDVSMLAAGVVNSEGETGPEFDHMTLMVTLDQRWLADVGFGDSFMKPLLLDERGEQVQANGIFQIVETDEHLLLRRRSAGEDWKPMYRFTLQPHEYADYDEMCRYHQTSPESHFTKGRICSLATHDGRVTLSDMRLITTSGPGQREERLLDAQEEYDRILREQFGIVMK
jgi:N-hydroxyarylamine O-acetyltransferase